MQNALKQGLMALSLVLALSGCNTLSRLSEVGQPPKMNRIENPTTQANYQPVSLPMPHYAIQRTEPNSLWRAGARAFFKDQRASNIGDILTVTVEIKDTAQFSNQTSRSRSNAEGLGLPNVLGYEASFSKILPSAVDPANLIKGSSDSSSSGTGTTNRSETLELTVAAIVTDILPNGNLVIQGSQQVRVNFEMRDLYVTGVIRPEDITPDNTIPHDQIAEARISVGGRGHLTDVQQPRYGQQIYDIISPF